MVPPLARRFRRAAWLGGIVAVVAFAAVLFGGRLSLADPVFTSEFLDLQGRAMLAGRLDVAADRLGIEAICNDAPTAEGRCPGRAHVYFGVVPSVLRMPILAVTDRFDGRLAQPSMLLACIALVVALVRLLWVGRWVQRPERPVGPGEALIAAAWPVVGVCGTVVWYLASQPIVYHEAILWGLALSLLAYDALARYLLAPALVRLAPAVAWSLLAFHTRASVGLGPAVALCLTAAWSCWRWVRRRQATRQLRRPTADDTDTVDLGDPDPLGRLALAAVVGAALTVGSYVALNLVKFGTLYSLPLDRQVYTVLNPARQAALAANGGSLFGLRFVPTTLVQYLRPDAIRVTGWFPYTDFGPRPAVLGGVTFDTLSRSSSITATSPWLVLLAVAGTVVMIRRRRSDITRAFTLPLIGACVGAATVLTIAFIANRYLGDLLPPFVLAASVGAWGVAEQVPRRRRMARATVTTVITLAAAWSVLANGGLAVINQRLYGSPSPRSLAHFVEIQRSAPSAGSPPLRIVDAPPRAPRTDAPSQTRLLVREGSRCRALFVSDGAQWLLAEVDAARHVRIRVRDDELTTERRPLVQGVTVRRVGPDAVVTMGSFDSRAGRLEAGVTDIDLVEDPTRPTVFIAINGRPRMAVDVPLDTLRPDDAIGTPLPVSTPAMDGLAACGGG